MLWPQAHFMFWDDIRSQCGVVFQDGSGADFTNTNDALAMISHATWTAPKPLAPGDTTWIGYVDYSTEHAKDVITRVKGIVQPRLAMTITLLKFRLHCCGMDEHIPRRIDKVDSSYLRGMEPAVITTYERALRMGLSRLRWGQYAFPPGHEQHESGQQEGIDKAINWFADHKSTHVQSVELVRTYCCV